MTFGRLKLSMPALRCMEWTERHFSEFSKCSARLSDIAQKAGTTSDAFNISVKNFLKIANSNNIEILYKEIIKPVHVRAITYLLLNNSSFRKKVPISQKLLRALEKPLGRLSNLALLSLVRLWFEYFDRLGPEEILKLFGNFLNDRLEKKAANSNCSTEFQNLYEYGPVIFKKDGPARLVETIPPGSTLNDVFNKPGLQGYESGRFQTICRMLYYIDTLGKIPVGTHHSVLDEVIKRDVYEASYKDNLLIGHKILSIIIDRSPEEDISDSWQNVLLSIAGDPRVPKSSPKYQKWWAFLTQKQISKVCGWLSKVDLKLFLQALEEHGVSSGNTDLQRMFPSRKKFLEGLIKQGLVKHSRLFIGSNADKFFKSIYGYKELPSYARVLDSNRSIIYLHVGNCHMIEGSHSFKLWIFTKLPDDIKILNYTKREFSVSDLSTSIVSECSNKFPNNFYYTSIVHSPSNFNWQHKAISFLRSAGESLDLEEIFTNNEYSLYKKMYGA
ncbi:EH signature domain-containing protein [Desulfomicrobium sp. ZS1]|uniref:EH signature domain-containing protein n=1 Tax=Desulfomicrobium sp. ZS1 TaxID=2952228 RepID=UPI0020B1DD3C|nr:EH signature domain-containing protein [Desulfomicrobium sp. ZS1]UTF51785.1 EH signature domain-containing protein [Desulfomicrobium sp. ZS1]